MLYILRRQASGTLTGSTTYRTGLALACVLRVHPSLVGAGHAAGVGRRGAVLGECCQERFRVSGNSSTLHPADGNLCELC